MQDQQLEWNSIVDRPGTSKHMLLQEIQDLMKFMFVVIDDAGDVTGNAGTILEKHVALSKAKDGEYSVGSTAYWRKYLYNTFNTSIWWISTCRCCCNRDLSMGSGFTAATDIAWDQNVEGIILWCFRK